MKELNIKEDHNFSTSTQHLDNESKPGHCGAPVFSDVSVCVFCFLWKEIPAEAAADMGRQEGDYAWKKTTENIQEIFDFIEELGS